jgi:large subunit ribosomal protein L1
MELSEATRVLRVSVYLYHHYRKSRKLIPQALEISNPSSAYSLTLTTHHSKSSLPLRGRVQLPLEARRAPEVILVFAEPSSPSFDAATAAGAHIIGGEELFPKILSGEIQPTKILSTPGMMPAVSKSLARYLGPKGLMPSAKRGGVGEGEELGKRIKEAGGTLEWKADKLGVIRARTSIPPTLSIVGKILTK